MGGKSFGGNVESDTVRSIPRKPLIAPPGGDGFAHASALLPDPDAGRLASFDTAFRPRHLRAVQWLRASGRVKAAGEQEFLKLNRKSGYR